MNQFDFFMKAPTQNIQSAITKTQRYIELHSNIVCSISGGSDSDIMLDMIYKLDTEKKVRYIFIDTGLEMEATKNHIEYLESKYDICVEIIKPKKPIPTANKEYGEPFYSKIFSENISRLQKHNFKWEDKPFEELYKEYPKCKAALRWWCSTFGSGTGMNNIASAKCLKEFMVLNPPTFKISPKCCDCGKKEPAYKAQKGADMVLVGIRKGEGGVRSISYKSCFMYDKKHGYDKHFPIFWFTDNDKKAYCETFDVIHSKAYTTYGCKRTGCAGCPFGSRFETELNMLEQYEPNLCKACNNIFKNSYEYTRKYKNFKEKKVKERKSHE